MVKLYCRTRLCALHSLCRFYILQPVCTLPKRFRLVLTVFRDEIQSAFEDPKMIQNKYKKPHLFTGSSKLHFGSSFCRCFSLHYTSYLFIHYVLCSVNPIFLSSVFYFCLSPLIFLSFLCKTLSHAWSGCHFRSLLLPSLLIAAFLLSVYIFAVSLTFSFVFIFASFSCFTSASSLRSHNVSVPPKHGAILNLIQTTGKVALYVCVWVCMCLYVCVCVCVVCVCVCVCVCDLHVCHQKTGTYSRTQPVP